MHLLVFHSVTYFEYAPSFKTSDGTKFPPSCVLVTAEQICSLRNDAKNALERWYHTALKAEWKNLPEIKVDFPSVDYVGNQHYVFNIRGNKYRLVVVVKFTIGYIFVRFVGTHEEYDKIDCGNI